MAALPASSKPVVPMMMLTPFSTHFCRCLRVGSGRVKSMSTSLWARTASTLSEMAMPVLMPEAKPASKPNTSEPECSSAPERMVSGWLLTASTSTRPMRPLTPAMAIFNALMRFPYTLFISAERSLARPMRIFVRPARLRWLFERRCPRRARAVRFQNRESDRPVL